MKYRYSNAFAMSAALALLVTAYGCATAAQRRATFTENMSNPAERFSASTRPLKVSRQPLLKRDRVYGTSKIPSGFDFNSDYSVDRFRGWRPEQNTKVN